LILKKSARLVLSAVCVLLVSQSAVADDLEPPYGIDDRLIVSVAEPGDQSFQDTNLPLTEFTSVIAFDSVNGLGYCDEYPLTAGQLTVDEYGQNTSGEALLAQRLISGYLEDIGYGEGTITCYPAQVVGGASATGSFVQTTLEWTVRFKDRQKYVGFWWSSGDDDNTVQLLNADGSDLLSPGFTASSLNQILFGKPSPECVTPNSFLVDAYCGNPNEAWAESSSELNYGPPPNFFRANPYQPYAFIHLRHLDGFYGIRFSGGNFEFDNLTFSDVAPPRGYDEQVVGEDTTTTYTLATSPVIPVDPRSPRVSFPGIVLGGDAADEPDATLCFTQVTDSSGTTAVSSGDATIRLEIHGAFNVSQFFGSPNFVFSGSQNDVKNFSSQIRILNSVAGRSVVTSTPVWIRVSVSPASSGGEATCTTTAGEITSAVVELRPLRLTNKNQSQVSLD
jgi:hypothetical protein